MPEHTFGGTWTEKKLNALREYLVAYRKALSKTTFTQWYVDAFAGTGSRAVSDSKSPFFETTESSSDAEAFSYLDGSAKIALGLTDPFDRYLFIEKSKARADELKGTIDAEFCGLASRCLFVQDDANTALSAWCAERDWSKRLPAESR